VAKYDFFIFEVVKAHVAMSPKHPETLHYTGDGVFMVAGKIVSRRSRFRPEMLQALHLTGTSPMSEQGGQANRLRC
jgi:hypothetical protein